MDSSERVRQDNPPSSSPGQCEQLLLSLEQECQSVIDCLSAFPWKVTERECGRAEAYASIKRQLGDLRADYAKKQEKLEATMSTTKLVMRLVEERITKLKADNEVLTRQLPFLAQRVDDMKALLQENTRELVKLLDFLATLKGDEE